MKKMILIAALTLVLTAAAVPGVAASFAENAGVCMLYLWRYDRRLLKFNVIL